MNQSIVIVPGIGNSKANHWQSHWEAEFSGARRIAPASWDTPDLADWIAALDATVARAEGPAVLICYSLGCVLFAHWRNVSTRSVRAAFLVAVPDPDGPRFPAAAKAFAALPTDGFGKQPILAIASSDDPYDPSGQGIAWATKQGATPILLGERDHLNGVSGLAGWGEGRALFTAFMTGLGG
ncbi:RBBP9/YdeN family alpha/beta hydrolase [Pseudomonas chlororaphis]|uniref:RBBP9/YdeN family alpha/beta hydrolase n=1 Tax=Pseudomonas chlororaphis TaxID=587753 RepID=UPI001B31B7CD|nr:alpha/beta hydrolase [Pseudomonas chlororaphis]MBP5057470.1 serine hydrolase family protein [Pseudomonas chlororaphis]MBP5142047.1 serine hydrolase family protein [Pseudomonas chlororaphis]